MGCLCLPGLLCFLIGLVVIVLHYLRPKVLKAFFDLSEDQPAGDGMQGEVYVNPHFKTSKESPYDNFALTIQTV